MFLLSRFECEDQVYGERDTVSLYTNVRLGDLHLDQAQSQMDLFSDEWKQLFSSAKFEFQPSEYTASIYAVAGLEFQHTHYDEERLMLDLFFKLQICSGGFAAMFAGDGFPFPGALELLDPPSCPCLECICNSANLFY